MTSSGGGTAEAVEEHIRGAYDAFHRKDIDDILSYFDPEIVWVHPDSMSDVGLGGAKYGHAGMREFLAHVPTVLGGMRLDPQEFLVLGERAVVFGGREVTSLDGRTAHMRFVHSWTFRDGKALRFEDYFDTAEMRRLIDTGDDPASERDTAP